MQSYLAHATCSRSCAPCAPRHSALTRCSLRALCSPHAHYAHAHHALACAHYTRPRMPHTLAHARSALARSHAHIHSHTRTRSALAHTHTHSGTRSHTYTLASRSSLFLSRCPLRHTLILSTRMLTHSHALTARPHALTPSRSSRALTHMRSRLQCAYA